MTRFTSLLALPLVALALVSGTAATPALADEKAQAMRSMSETKSPALVTIKFILKGEEGDSGMFGGGDREEEATGVMIDGTGLVLVSNLSMGGNPFAAMMGMGAGPQPQEIKVLAGDDTQGVDAKLIARDSELNLAWVRVDKAPEKPFAAVDLNTSADVGVGDEVFVVARMGKFFDRAVTVSSVRISGQVNKPRKAMLGGEGMFNSLGLPVYNSEGKLVGISSIILPNADEMEGMQGGMSGMRDMMAGAIIPAKDIAEATKNALENAAKAPAEEPKEEPAAETKPAEAPAKPE